LDAINQLTAILYIQNNYTQYTHVYWVNKLLFWMWIIAINHFTTLLQRLIYVFIH